MIVKPNEVINVALENKPQQKIFNLTKLGKSASQFATEESEYGTLNKFIFNYQPLIVVEYEIRAVEYIVINAQLHYEAGEVVTSVVTGEDGKIIDMPKIYLGKYEAIEVAVPTRYIIDSTTISFEFTYQSQEIEYVNHDAETKNEFQKQT